MVRNERVWVGGCGTKASISSAADMMTRTLSELLALVKQLREEVGQQRNEIAYLRQLIENCAGCKERPEPLRDTCLTNNPCFPGGFLLPCDSFADEE